MAQFSVFTFSTLLALTGCYWYFFIFFSLVLVVNSTVVSAGLVPVLLAPLVHLLLGPSKGGRLVHNDPLAAVLPDEQLGD